MAQEAVTDVHRLIVHLHHEVRDEGLAGVWSQDAIERLGESFDLDLAAKAYAAVRELRAIREHIGLVADDDLLE